MYNCEITLRRLDLIVVKMLKKILRFLLYLPVGYFVYFLSLFVPKNSNIWVFGSWFGNKFADNSKYLFLYVKKFHPEIRALWFTHNENVYSQLLNEGYEVYKINSLKAFLYATRAGYVIVSTGANDVLGVLSKFIKVNIIQLWHGTPLKKLREVSNFNKKFVDFAKKILPFYGERYRLVLATSELSRKSMTSVFAINEEKVVVTGYPRNDAFFANWAKKSECQFVKRIKENIGCKNIIAYLPTCRGIGSDIKIDLFKRYKFDPLKVQKTLEKINGAMVMKPHFYNTFEYDKTSLSTNRIFVVSDLDFPDIYEFLPYVDILITDYSSVYFDFLLLNRPIIFAPFDINEFVATTTELFYKYDEVTPGPKAKSWDEVIECILESATDRKKYESERKKVSTVFNKYADGSSSMRVYNAIMELLNEKKKEVRN